MSGTMDNFDTKYIIEQNISFNVHTKTELDEQQGNSRS